MDETGCHIHFPDSNRSNPNEKSNQVSIAGDIAGVEKARASLRAVTPLIFSFELPVLGANQTVPDLNSPRVQQIQEGYNVQVSSKLINTPILNKKRIKHHMQSLSLV